MSDITADHDSSDNVLWGDLSKLVTLPEILKAVEVLKDYEDVLCTPLHLLVTKPSNVDTMPAKIYLKLDNLQTTGSFKIRGMTYKLHQADKLRLKQNGAVTMSAGNAGRAIAYLCEKFSIPCQIFMPETVPDERKILLESYGATVTKVPGPELLSNVKRSIIENGKILVHPFDDLDIIRGHASCGIEILEENPNVDVVLVCCGGGGLLAGVASGIKLNWTNAQGRSKDKPAPLIIGVEPTGANSMHLSVENKKHMWCLDGGKTNTIAHGLAPPFAGKSCFNHVEKFVDEIVLVTDDEMRFATKFLFEEGIVAEVSGAASTAALLFNKVTVCSLENKNVVCIVTGRNIGLSEFTTALDLDKPINH